MIRLLLKACVLLALVAAGYVASPFWAAWAIREAVTKGDSRYLETKVHWPTVRETMRSSMLLVALDLPDPEVTTRSVSDLRSDTYTSVVPRPGVWARIKTRIKTSLSHRAVNKLVTSYITAEGLPKLYAARKYKKMLITGAEGDPTDAVERFRRVWARIKRAEFKTMTQFDIEIEDQFEAGRRYAATLELQSNEWILTGLKIRSSDEISRVADAGH